jgi:hypothetical protein
MTDPATTPTDRRKRVVRAVMAHRKDGTPATFVAGDVRVTYDDRLLELTVDEAERDRLDVLLAEYPVFKVKQPETRKAPEGTVVVSAIADPKHLADFVDDCFRQVYDRTDDYPLVVD